MVGGGALLGTARVRLELDRQRYDRDWKRVERDTHGMGRKLTAAGKYAIAGTAAIGAGALAAGKKLSDMAGDAAEVESKFKVTFGKEMPRLVKELNKFSRATGASRYELRQQTADLGALLVPLMGNRKEAGKMSTAFVRLATDLSSFNNVPVEESLVGLRAALVGEYEPARRFGVILNEAKVQAEALRLSGKKNADQLTDSEKVQARYNLILKQTKLAQGDATRTAGSYTNQKRRLRNIIRDTATDLGKLLVPAFAGFVGFLNKRVMPQVESFVGFLTDIFKQHTFTAKVKVALQGGLSLGRAGLGKIQDLLFGDLGKKPIKMPLGKVVEFETTGHQGLFASLAGADWAGIGKKIGEGITTGIDVGTAWLDRALSASLAWVQAHGQQVANVGAEILARVFVTLTDPVFWAHHWELALAIGLTALGGPLGKLGGLIGRLFARLLGRAFGTALISVLARLPEQIAAPILAGVLLSIRYLGRIITWFSNLPLKLKALVAVAAAAVARGFADLVNRAIEWIKDLWEQIKGWKPSFEGVGYGLARALGMGLLAGLAGLATKVGEKLRGLLPDRPSWLGGGNQRGAMIHGRGFGDTVPAMLEPGEGVLNRNAVRGLGGPSFVNWANSTWPRFAAGGNVGRKRGRVDELPQLPGSIELAQARAALTKTTKDDIRALRREERFWRRQSRRPRLTQRARAEALRNLKFTLDEIASLIEQGKPDPSAPDTPSDTGSLLPVLTGFLSEFGPNIFNRGKSGFLGFGSSPLAGASGVHNTRQVTVNQFFNKVPEDAFAAMRSSEFAAKAVFG